MHCSRISSDIIKQNQLDQLLSSPFYSVMIGESTDVAFISEMMCMHTTLNKGLSKPQNIRVITNHASRLVFRNDPEIKWPPQCITRKTAQTPL